MGVFGAVRGTVGYRGNYCTGIGRSDSLLYKCTHTENIKNFE
jgi:hypothetical protein